MLKSVDLKKESMQNYPAYKGYKVYRNTKTTKYETCIKPLLLLKYEKGVEVSCVYGVSFISNAAFTHLISILPKNHEDGDK